MVLRSLGSLGYDELRFGVACLRRWQAVLSGFWVGGEGFGFRVWGGGDGKRKSHNLVFLGLAGVRALGNLD